MGPVNPIEFVTPDGVTRRLRFTMGARRRLSEKYGGASLVEIFNKHGDNALVDLLYLCMFDEQGRPPDITIEALAEMMPGDAKASTEALAAFLSAVTRGATPPKDMEALLKQALEANLTGFISGVLPGSASDSVIPNSGGESVTPNSPPSLTDTASESGDETSAPA